MSLLNNDFLPKLTFNGDSKMSVINSNSAAMITANSLNKNDREMSGIMERLSTGKRINSSADDAAGLAIATKMTAQVRGLDQAGRNANNATSMLQLADGAAEQVSNILQRMREITVQASDGSNSQADIDIINVEFKQAAQEIDRIVDATEFNGKKLLNGDAGSVGNSTVSFQIGANTGQTLDVSFGDFNLADGGEGGVKAALNYQSGVAANITFEYTQDITFQAPDGGSVTITSEEMTTLSIDTTQEVREEANLRFAAQDVDLFISQGTGGTSFILETTSFGDQTSWTSGFSTGTVNNAGNLVSQPVIANFNAAGNAQNGTLANPTGTTYKIDGEAGGPMGDDLSDFALTTVGMGTDLSDTLEKLDVAITGVATQRATFGASMNRLTSVVDNLASASEATMTARGRIEDANYASETTALARSQIISQAGTAMLAQANQKAQSVLSLLQ